MFEHIVLLKFKPDVSIEAKESAIKRAHDFKRNIPGIVELSVGINVTEEIEHMQGFTLGIRVTFEDQQALPGLYSASPASKFIAIHRPVC